MVHDHIFPPLEQIRLRQQSANFFRNVARLFLCVMLIFRQLLQHHHKLITAETCRTILTAYAGQNASRHLHQHLVADVVAVQIVQHLEVIQIQKHQCAMLAIACRRNQCTVQPVNQQTAVWQSGQRIVKSQIMHFSLELITLCDVVNDGKQQRSALHLDRRGMDLDRAYFTIGKTVVEGEKIAFFLLRLQHAPGGQLLWLNIDLSNVHSCHLLDAIAIKFRCRMIGIHNTAANRFDQQHRRGMVFEHTPETRLAFPQLPRTAGHLVFQRRIDLLQLTVESLTLAITLLQIPVGTRKINGYRQHGQQ